jgi:heme/copper-type cytochrome/quinol oxidase subunit 3
MGESAGESVGVPTREPDASHVMRIPEDHWLPEPSTSVHDTTQWGMSLVCISEGVFFACALASYFYLSGRSPVWPPAGIDPPDLRVPTAMTVLLLCSSFALAWGERGFKRGLTRRLPQGIALTIVLGLGFLALQVREYGDKLRHFVPQTHAYTATFFTITGFHGMHVAVGLLMLALLGVRALRGHFSTHPRPQGHAAVSATSLYWHFVDGVWLVIFTTLYLFPHVGRM